MVNYFYTQIPQPSIIFNSIRRVRWAQFHALCIFESTGQSITLYMEYGLLQTNKLGTDNQWKINRSKARRGSLFNNVTHLIQCKLQHIWAPDCQLDMNLLKCRRLTRVIRGVKKKAQLYRKTWQAASRRDVAVKTVISDKGEYQGTGLKD